MNTKFEYDVRNLKSLNKEILNEIGQDGWQVVNVETQSDHTYTIMVMREIQVDPMEALQNMLGSFNKSMSQNK